MEGQCTEGFEMTNLTEEFGAVDEIDSVDLNEKREEEMDEAISPDEFKEEQHRDTCLRKVRDKAQHAGSPYFWENGLLLRKPYCGMGKDLVIVSKGARNKVMRLAHVSMVAGHFTDRRLQMIRGRMNWPVIAKDVRVIFDSCPVFQKAPP